jgi:hypothetical protein
LESLRRHPFLTVQGAGQTASRHSMMCAMGVDIFNMSTPTGDKIVHRFSAEYPNEVIERAIDGDRLAHEALREVAEQMHNLGTPLPSKLQRYLIDVARDGFVARRGRHSDTNLLRDDAIYRSGTRAAYIH